MLKDIISLNKRDFFLGGGLMLGLFAVTQIIIAAVMVFLKPDTSILISGSTMVLSAGILMLVFGAVNTSFCFSLAVRFGQTRRRALAAAVGLTAAEGILVTALAALLDWLERHIFVELWRVLAGKAVVAIEIGHGRYEYPDSIPWKQVLAVEDFTLLPWWGLPAIALGCALMGLFFGACMVRFGNKGSWVIMAAFWAPYLIIQFLPWDASWFTFPWLVPALVLLAVAAVVWSIWTLLHAPIK